MSTEPESESPELLVGGNLADQLRQIELFSRFQVEGIMNGVNRSPLIGFSTDFRQHRQYFPGDNLKHLDWRIYGRSGRLMIRQYEENTNARISVVIDVSGSMNHAGEGMTKWDFAMRTAAVLLHVAFLHRDAFSLTGFGTSRERHVSFGSGKTHLLRCFRSLLADGAEGETDFDSGLGGAIGPIRKKGLTVVLSDFMDSPEVIANKLARLRFQGSDVIALQVIEPSERDLDFNAITRFHDLESADVLAVDPQLIRRKYREAFDEHIIALKEACRRHGFEHIELMVQDDFAVPVLEYLRWRMERFQ
ncbi:MAG: DUF58 domain-containing protein [Planctomycetota bacterium]|nr:DUF58 domain-containing protein [Planctomycetota bacterium]